MMKEKIEEIVLGIIEDIAPDEDLKNMDYDKPIRDQIGLDSMDFLDIVMELRKQYKVEVPEKEYENLRTMNSTIEYLKDKVPEEYLR